MFYTLSQDLIARGLSIKLLAYVRYVYSKVYSHIRSGCGIIALLYMKKQVYSQAAYDFDVSKQGPTDASYFSGVRGSGGTMRI